MTLFWFVIAGAVVIVGLVVLLLVRQYRSRDFANRIDPRDVPSNEYNQAQAQAAVTARARGGGGPFWF